MYEIACDQILEQPLNNFKYKLGEEFWTSTHYVHDICSCVNFLKLFILLYLAFGGLRWL